MAQSKLQHDQLRALLQQAADNTLKVRAIAASETRELHAGDELVERLSHAHVALPIAQKGVIDWAVLLIVAVVNLVVIIGANAVTRHQVQKSTCLYQAEGGSTMSQARSWVVTCPAPAQPAGVQPAPAQEDQRGESAG